MKPEHIPKGGNMCEKTIRTGSQIVTHDEMLEKCHPLGSGWCCRYEGGGPKGVDASASVVFYDPQGTPQKIDEVPPAVRVEFKRQGLPLKKSTY